MNQWEIPIKSTCTHSYQFEISFQNVFGVFDYFVLIKPKRIGSNCAVVINTEQTYAYSKNQHTENISTQLNPD